MLSRIPLLVLMAGVLMLMGTAAAPAQYDASPSESFIVSYKPGQRAVVRKYSSTADVYSASVWQKHKAQSRRAQRAACAGCPFVQALASVQSAGMKLIREYTDFQLLIVTPPATSASGGGPDAGAAAAATAVASLRSRQSISAVGVNPIMRIPEQVVVPLSDAPGTIGESSSRGAAVGIKPAQQQNDSCDAGSDPLNPDVNLGRTSEGVPWGIAAVQGADPVVQQLAQQYRSKVLYCVLDSGLDIANKEFDANSEWRSMCV